MAESTADARQEVENARRAVASELDELGAAARAAVDIPTKVRRNPARTAGLATGAAFLLLGGPKRVAKAAERRFLPRRAERAPKVLPKEVEDTVNRLEPDQRDRVRAHLERDFTSYLRRKHPEEPANARRSLWRTYDIMVGIVGAAAARELVKKLFEIPQETKVEAIKEEGEAVAEAEAKITAAKRR